MAAALLIVALTGVVGASETGGTSVTPYDTEARIWRDEQPGAEARLHMMARLVPRPGAEAWSDVVLAGLELRAESRTWTPETSTLRETSQGGLELHAEGAATLEAGTTVVPVIELTTSAGARQLVLPTSVVRIVR